MPRLPRTITIDKKVGETPLQALDALRVRDSRFEDVKLAYAGRLDPMASGKLLVVVGEECKRHHSYLGLDKEYEIEVVFGVSSDTGDVLGIAKACGQAIIEELVLRHAISEMQGEVALPFPAYSSKPVEGRPLFQWALEGRLSEIDIPVQHSHIYSIQLKSLMTLSSEELQTRVSENIESFPEVTELSKMGGRDFRRDEVRASWKSIKKEKQNTMYVVARITCVCSSGTYMRTLANVLAKKLGTCGLALSIRRRKIGKYVALSNWGFWVKQY